MTILLMIGYFGYRTRIPKNEPPDVIARGGLELKVCVRTYRLFFVSDTEDVLWRISTQEEHDDAQRRLEARNKKRREWVERLNRDRESVFPRRAGEGAVSPAANAGNAAGSTLASASVENTGAASASVQAGKEREQPPESAERATASMDADVDMDSVLKTDMNGAASSKEKPVPAQSESAEMVTDVPAAQAS